MKVGDLIRWCDWESTGGMTTPNDGMGIIISAVHSEGTLPTLFEVMTFSGELIEEYSDELEIIKIKE